MRWSTLALILASLSGSLLCARPAAADDAAARDLGDRLARDAFVAPIRWRHEVRDDEDFRADKDDGDNRDLVKIGFGVDTRPIDALRARLELRATRTAGRNKVDHLLQLDPFGQDAIDAFEAFGELRPLSGVPVALRAGRQTLIYGEERLIGPLEWVQNARTWDGVRVLLGDEKRGVDLFWARRVQFEGPDDHNRNRPVDQVDLFGAYGALTRFPFRFEPFWLVRHDDNDLRKGEQGVSRRLLLVHSPGARLVIDAPEKVVTLTTEGAYQFGRRGPDDVSAFGIAQRVLCRMLEPLRPLTEIELEYIYGSGDENPTDGTSETFDNFYPTNHKFYGEQDFASWQNIHDVEVTARFALGKVPFRAPPPQPAKGAPKPPVWERALATLPPPVVPVTLEIGAHGFWLASDQDAWYNAALKAVRRDPTGKASRELGQEIDVVLRAGPVYFGYAHFFAGGFIRDTTPAGGEVADADFFYAEVMLKF